MYFQTLARQTEDENICHEKRSKLLVQGWYLLSEISNQNEELCLEGRVAWDTRTGLSRQAQSWAPLATAGHQMLLLVREGNGQKVNEVI